MELIIVLVSICRACLVSRDADVEACPFVVTPLGERLCVQHLTVVTATIDLIYLCATQQVDLGVL